MKTILLFFTLFFCAISGFALPDDMSITVDAGTAVFQKRNFENGALFFTNRTYVIQNAPVDFTGCEFLSSGGKVADQGVIIPSRAGKIYLIAPTGTLSGWTIVPNTDFNYSDGNLTKVSIFEKQVVANERVEIPNVTSFPGASPIAKTINILDPQSDAGLSTITINGIPIESFYKNTFNYSYYFAHTYDAVPVVDATTAVSTAQKTITQATSITGTLADCTSTIEVKSQDNTNVQIYKVVFQKLTQQLALYLCIGQSNMGGRAPILPEDSASIPGVWVLKDKNEWVKGKNPMNVYSSIQGGDINKMNPAYAFSIKMRSLVPDQEIGIISNARGATGRIQWMPGTTYYNEAVKRAKWAMQYGTIKGILWHQGEEDTKIPSNIPIYLDSIKIFINALRADLGNPTLPFIAGQISRVATSYANFNIMILDFPGILPNTDLVLTDGLTTLDNVHFDTPSMKKLGERYADKMYPLVYATSKVVDTEGDAGFVKRLFVNGKIIYVECNLTYDVIVSDLTGRIVYMKNNSDYSTIDLTQFQSGIYLLKIQNESNMFSQKIVLQ